MVDDVDARVEAPAVSIADPARVQALVEQVPGGADPISELPVDGLRLLAELLGPTPKPTGRASSKEADSADELSRA